MGEARVRAKIVADDPELAAHVIALHREAKIDRMMEKLLSVPPPRRDDAKRNEKEADDGR
jgi:hypothetical protein